MQDGMMIANGRGALADSRGFAHLAIGTMLTRDLNKARRRYRDYFGLECVTYAPGRMMCRDRRSKYLMEAGARDFFLLDVREVEDIVRPQTMLNHWGFSLPGEAEVDRARQAAVDRADELGFAKVHPAINIHGSYSSYMFDEDENWWEVEYRRDLTNDLLFSRGDWNSEAHGTHPVADPPLAVAATAPSVLGDDVFMTHGTTSVFDCDAARGFYEDVLKLRTVRHVRPSHCFAGGGDFGVIGVGAKEKIIDQVADNRFVLLIDDDDALDAAHARVAAAREAHGLLALTDIEAGEFGGRHFLLRTRDRIWFELSSRSRGSLRALFQ